MNNPIVVPMTVATYGVRSSVDVSADNIGVVATPSVDSVGVPMEMSVDNHGLTPSISEESPGLPMELAVAVRSGGGGAVTGVKGNAESTYRTGNVNLTADDIGVVIPTDLSDFTNDVGYIIGSDVPSNETDPTVPSWAKASSKPSYTAAEVGALPDTTVIPTKTSDLQNDSHFVSDSNYVHTDNNFTSTAKAKLGTIEGYAQKNIIEEVHVNGTALTVTNKAVDVTVPTNTSDLNNDSGYLTSSDAVTSFNGAVGAVTYSAHEVPSGGNAGQVLKKISATDYDYGWRNESEILPSAYCTTSGSTAAKKASCSLWAASSNSYLHFLLGSANTSASALTLEINVTGAKPVYINGEASSATNYSLPAGSYIIFYDGTNYHFRTDGKLPADIKGISGKTASIPMGWLDDTSTATVMTAQVDGITELRNGVCCYLTNGVITSASGWTLNINGLGAKPVYQSMAAASRTTTIFNVAYTGLFVYNENRVEGGCWDYFYGYNSDTNTIAYSIRNYQSSCPLDYALYRYQFLFTKRDGHLFPTNNVSNKPSVYTKVLNTDAFDPKRDIYYYTTTTTIGVGSYGNASYLYKKYYACDMRYGFNVPSNLTAKEPVYLRCVPQTDKTLVLDGDSCVTQTLPTTADNKVYLYLGVSYSTYQIELSLEHPCYIYDSNISAVTTWG